MLQYDSDKNAWSGLLVDTNNARKGIVNVGEEADKFFSKTKSWKPESLSNLSKINDVKFDSFIKQQGLADESLIAFLKDTNYAKKDLANYQLYLKDTGKATTTFATLTKKAGNVLKSFGASLVSMGVSWLAGQAFGLIIKGLDNLFHAEEKAAEKAEETVQKTGEAFDKIKSDLQELNSLIKEYNDLHTSGQWDNTDIETKKQLQKDINSLLDDEVDKLDIVEGKYENITAELYKQRLKKLGETEKAASDALKAEKNALWDENKNNKLEFKYGEVYSRNKWFTKRDESKPKYFDDIDTLKHYLEEYDDIIQASKKTQISANIKTSSFIGTKDVENVEDLITLYDRLKQMAQEMYDNGDTGAFYDSVNAYLKELEPRVETIHGYEDDFDESTAANSLGKILKDSNNGFGGYVETLEEYKQVVEHITNGDYENKDLILKALADDFPEFSSKVKETTVNLDKMTVSLSDLESTSEKISKLGTAFKELSSDGFISIKALNELKTTLGLSEAKWAKYEHTLMNVKAGSAEAREVMADLAYQILENELGVDKLVNAEDEYILRLLQENGFSANAATAQYMIARAKALNTAKTLKNKEAIDNAISSLATEAGTCNLTESAFKSLIAQEIVFNNTGLDVTQKIAALRELAGEVVKTTGYLGILHYYGTVLLSNDVVSSFTLPDSIISEKYNIFIACTSPVAPREGNLVRYLPWDGGSDIYSEGGTSGGYIYASLHKETNQIAFLMKRSGITREINFDLYCVPVASAIELTAD